jgi:hypothetical protein
MRLDHVRCAQEKNRIWGKGTLLRSQTASAEQADVRSLRACGTFGMTSDEGLGV